MDIDQDTHEPFFLHYSMSHISRYGEEFQEFDIVEFNDHSGGRIRYANESGYRKKLEQGKDTILREVFVSSLTIREIKRVLRESEVMATDPALWPDVTSDGSQKLVIRMDGEGFNCRTATIGRVSEVEKSVDPEGLRKFHYLVQHLQAMVMGSLISLHLKPDPIRNRAAAPV